MISHILCFHFVNRNIQHWGGESFYRCAKRFISWTVRLIAREERVWHVGLKAPGSIINGGCEGVSAAFNGVVCRTSSLEGATGCSGGALSRRGGNCSSRLTGQQFPGVCIIDNSGEGTRQRSMRVGGGACGDGVSPLTDFIGGGNGGSVSMFTVGEVRPRREIPASLARRLTTPRRPPVSPQEKKRRSEEITRVSAFYP